MTTSEQTFLQENIHTNILEKIILHKRTEVIAAKKLISEIAIKKQAEKSLANSPPRNFYQAITNTIEKERNNTAIIAEIKKASPSRGIIRKEFNPVEIAKDYETNGAACLSVLTDNYFFQGKIEYINYVKNAVTLAVLRKDFIIDEYQIYETRACGADAILLITSCLEDKEICKYAELSNYLNMTTLIEIHNKSELERIKMLALPQKTMLGINNRNLKTFNVEIKTTTELAPHIPKRFIVSSESGIKSNVEIKVIKESGINSFLIGETFMKCKSPGKKLAELLQPI